LKPNFVCLQGRGLRSIAICKQKSKHFYIKVLQTSRSILVQGPRGSSKHLQVYRAIPWTSLPEVSPWEFLYPKFHRRGPLHPKVCVSGNMADLGAASERFTRPPHFGSHSSLIDANHNYSCLQQTLRIQATSQAKTEAISEEFEYGGNPDKRLSAQSRLDPDMEASEGFHNRTRGIGLSVPVPQPLLLLTGLPGTTP
jgi:hypothetical protein